MKNQLPQLRGSEKQIAWAEKIREIVIKYSFLAEKSINEDDYEKEEYRQKILDFFRSKFNDLLKVNDSNYFINNFKNYPDTIDFDALPKTNDVEEINNRYTQKYSQSMHVQYLRTLLHKTNFEKIFKLYGKAE